MPYVFQKGEVRERGNGFLFMDINKPMAQSIDINATLRRPYHLHQGYTTVVKIAPYLLFTKLFCFNEIRYKVVSSR